VSNFLAVATVTATIRDVLQVSVGTDVAGATVTTQRPDGTTGGGTTAPAVNIYLYRVSPNAAFRNADLPTRNSGGQLLQKPQVALDLHYLFTFQGDETTLEPQRLLGSVERTLHAQSTLSRQAIAKTSASHPFLAKSNLADQIELVRFTPSELSLEELSKLWSVFFQTPYSLSVVYQGTVVLIETDDVVRKALPVLSRNLYVKTFRQPFVERVISQAGEMVPIIAGSNLLIEGEQFMSDETLVLLGGSLRQPAQITDTSIVVPVPADLAAGVQGLQVIERVKMGTPEQPHPGFASNAAAFVLQPVATPTNVTAANITVQMNPKVRKGQRCVLLLDKVPGSAAASFAFPTAPAVATVDTNTLQFNLTGVGSGTYFLRVQVDGAESAVDLDPASANFGPKVNVP